MNSILKHLVAVLSLLVVLPTSSIAAGTLVEVPPGALAGDAHWFATNEYLLTGYTYVLSNSVLQIDAGTVIRGRNGSAPNFGVLYVCQGGKIMAEGTAQQPIIFTAEADDLTDPTDLGPTDRGLWGGVVVFGNARINHAVDASGDAASPKYEVYEGLEDRQINGQYVHRFGGSDDDDNSGVLRYVSIRHGGQALSPDKEINGLSLGGVGRGTTIEYVEAYATADDGFEFFGGSVNTKHLVSAFNDDDGFDTDLGYNGKNQFWFGIQINDRRDNGSEQNGEPNERNDGLGVPVANYQIYNATLLGAGATVGGATTNNNGMLLRRYVQAQWYNSIISDFNGQPLNGGGPQTGAAPTLMDNVWWGFAIPVFTNDLFTVAANNNSTTVDPQLRSIGRDANGALDPRPQPGSPALTSTRTPPSDGFFEPVTYKGAFNANDDWMQVWTALSQSGLLAPQSPVGNVVIWSEQAIATNVTWSASNVYLLTNYVYVLSNAVLRIEAGTVIKGRNGTAPNFGCLFVCQGGKIYAEGTPRRPIIFTAEDDDVTDPTDLGPTDRGLWGGVVVFGNARINHAVDASGDAASPKYEVYEGLEDRQINGQYVHRFGGSDDDDNSGVLRYVSIRHGGQALSPDKEINGLSLGGVGRGTTIEYVEAYATADDGFEFFGGSVNTKHLVSAFNDDDGFDTDLGYNGKNQFWFGIQINDRRDNGSEQNGEPNERNDGLGVPVGNYQIYNATLLGAGATVGGATTNNNGMLLRRYVQAQWYNSIISDFNGQPLNGGGPQTGAAPTLMDNVWWGFAIPVFTNDLFTVAANNNSTTVDPQLRGVGRDADGALDPRLQPGSPALTSTRTAPSDGFFEPVTYKGAFDASDNWLRNWTALSQDGFVPGSTNVITLSDQPITGDVTWYSTNVYILTGYVYVLSNAVLRIEPGTIIKGRNGTAPNFGCLFICRGAKIFAEGSPSNPIIFTAEDDDLSDPLSLGPTDRGLWGGVVVFGNARINHAVDASGDAASPKYEVYEGLEDRQINGQYVHRFGGSDDDDNSGVLRYVSIRHGGQALSPDKEINGLSLGGVGRGTTIEYVEAYATADDGFEFFGGSVNTKHLVSAFNDDDGFDTDLGYNGKNQFWFGIQINDRRDNGSEQNGEPNERNDGLGVPVANYQIYNATLLGAGATVGGATTNNNGMLLRRYVQAQWYNSIISDFNGQPLNGGGPQTGAAPTLMDNVWWGFAIPVFTNDLFTVAANNNSTTVDPQLRGISREPNDGLDPRPLPGSPALTSTRTPPADGFYSAANYKGAFADANWASDWTALSDYGILTAAGGRNPMNLPSGTTPVRISIAAQGTSLHLEWTGGTAPFTLQRTLSLDAPSWVDVGTTQDRSMTVNIEGAQGFFRISSPQ